MNGPIILDAGRPFSQHPPGHAAAYGDTAASVLEMEVVEPTEGTAIIPETSPKKAVRSRKTPKSKKVLSSDDLMSMDFDSLPFEGPWADLMQDPAKNMRLGIKGKPKNGKTAGTAQLANYLTNFGNVLYNFVDQGYNKSTKDIWKLAGLSKNPRAFATDIENLDELEKEIATGNYDTVIIDLINDYIDRTGITPQQFKDRFIKKYPDVSFILVFEVTKSGDFRGDQKWMHLVDAIIDTRDFVMYNRGRYGTGHYVVWEKGLKDADPKKYQELVGDKVDTESSETILIM